MFICILNFYSIDPIYSTIAKTVYIIICIRSILKRSNRDNYAREDHRRRISKPWFYYDR